MEHRRNETDRGKPKYSGEKPVPVPLCPPQIPHGLTRDRNRASAVGDRRLTAWAMARPLIYVNCPSFLNVNFVRILVFTSVCVPYLLCVAQVLQQALSLHCHQCWRMFGKRLPDIWDSKVHSCYSTNFSFFFLLHCDINTTPEVNVLLCLRVSLPTLVDFTSISVPYPQHIFRLSPDFKFPMQNPR
jgi:hypothetical protein